MYAVLQSVSSYTLIERFAIFFSSVPQKEEQLKDTGKKREKMKEKEANLIKM